MEMLLERGSSVGLAALLQLEGNSSTSRSSSSS